MRRRVSSTWRENAVNPDRFRGRSGQTSACSRLKSVMIRLTYEPKGEAGAVGAPGPCVRSMHVSSPSDQLKVAENQPLAKVS